MMGMTMEVPSYFLMEITNVATCQKPHRNDPYFSQFPKDQGDFSPIRMRTYFAFHTPLLSTIESNTSCQHPVQIELIARTMRSSRLPTDQSLLV